MEVSNFSLLILTLWSVLPVSPCNTLCHFQQWICAQLAPYVARRLLTP